MAPYHCCASGPETWWVYYPSASGGNQSPIDIVTEDAIVELDYAPGANPLQVSYAPALSSTCYNAVASEAMVLVNTGNTARVNITDSKSREWRQFDLFKAAQMTEMKTMSRTIKETPIQFAPPLYTKMGTWCSPCGKGPQKKWNWGTASLTFSRRDAPAKHQLQWIFYSPTDMTPCLFSS